MNKVSESMSTVCVDQSDSIPLCYFFLINVQLVMCCRVLLVLCFDGGDNGNDNDGGSNGGDQAVMVHESGDNGEEDDVCY